MNLKPHRQGDLDGLCGLYAILHILSDRYPECWSKSEAIDNFWHVLEAARECDILDPSRLIYGYFDYELKAIFDCLISRWAIPCEVHLVRRVVLDGSIADSLERILKAGCSAILNIAGRDHWVAVVPRKTGDKAGRVLDSVTGKKAVPTSKTNFCDGQGLILKPVVDVRYKLEL